MGDFFLKKKEKQKKKGKKKDEEEEEKRLILGFISSVCVCANHWHLVHQSKTRWSQGNGRLNHKATVNFKNYCKIFL